MYSQYSDAVAGIVRPCAPEVQRHSSLPSSVSTKSESDGHFGEGDGDGVGVGTGDGGGVGVGVGVGGGEGDPETIAPTGAYVMPHWLLPRSRRM